MASAAQTLDSPPKITMRRALLAQRVCGGQNVAEAGRQPGPDGKPLYAAKQSAHVAMDSVSEAIPAHLAKAGLTAEFLARKVKALCDAEELIFAKDHGEFTDVVSVPALGVQKDATELAFRLRGDLKADTGLTVNGNVQINWTGPTPAWVPEPAIDQAIPVTNASTLTERMASTDGEGGRSAIEGTETGKGAPPHTHSGKKSRGPRLPIRNKKYGAKNGK